MDTVFDETARVLPAGGLWVSGDVPTLVSVRCTHGTLWLTQAGHREDVLLQAGDEYAPLSAGKIVIEALTRSAFVCRAAPRADAAVCLAERKTA
jgi:hypothetical protein